MKNRTGWFVVGFLAVNAAVPPAHTEDSVIDDALRELEKQAEDLIGPEARKAIDSLLPMIEGFMNRLPLLIDKLPAYELPEVMPNGDIIIRRKRNLPKRDPNTPPLPQEGIKT